MAKTDYKVATASLKPRLALIPIRALNGIARVFEYGAKKYAPGNFLNATLKDSPGERYISATLRHLSEVQQEDGQITPTSLAAKDSESGLPHLFHAVCSLIMLIAILIKEGVLDDSTVQ